MIYYDKLHCVCVSIAKLQIISIHDFIIIGGKFTILEKLCI